jgi:hypothetical protein
MTTCNRIEKSGLCFSLIGLGEVNLLWIFWTTLVSNNREGTKEMSRDVVEVARALSVAWARQCTVLSDAV